MIELIKKIRRYLQFQCKFRYKLFLSHRGVGNTFVCVESAVHGNMGDQALGFCRIELLKRIGISESKIVEYTSSDRMRYWESIKKCIRPSDIILLRGGGCFGDLWEDGFEPILSFIESFPNNKIILFPQSVYFSNTTKGQQLLKKSTQIIGDRKNLYLFARDNSSYEKLKKIYPIANIYVTPDTVLSYKPSIKALRKDDVLFCLRKDKEKALDNNIINNIEDIVNKLGYKIKRQDTCIKLQIKNLNERRAELYRMWETFSNSKIVVTDRLHGMIFALITGTPCLVFDNIDSKIYNQYKMVSNLSYIKFVTNFSNIEIEENIKYLLNKNNNKYPVELIFKEFKPLVNVINKLK